MYIYIYIFHFSITHKDGLPTIQYNAKLTVLLEEAVVSRSVVNKSTATSSDVAGCARQCSQTGIETVPPLPPAAAASSADLTRNCILGLPKTWSEIVCPKILKK